MASSASSPYPKFALTRATTFSQFVIYAVTFSLLSSISYPFIPLKPSAIPSFAADFAAAASSFRASTKYPLK